jgi:hypothetical protein
MNERVNGIVFKENLNARVLPSEAPRKGRRRPLGLAPVLEELSPVSALDNVSEDVLNSPASIGDVLAALDSAIAITSDADVLLKVRLGRLEGELGELKIELAIMKVQNRDLKVALAELLRAPRQPEAKGEPPAKPELRVVVK